MKNRMIIALSWTLCLTLTAACAATDNEHGESQRENIENTAQTEIQKAERDETDETDTHTTADVEKRTFTELGIFVGQADQHTIEIETNEGPKAFRLTEQSAKQMKELKSNDKVKFEYTVNEKQQNILQKIEKIKDKLNNREVGIYNGQQDSNSIEIETSHGPTVFQLSDKAKEQIDSLEIGGKVSFTYRVDGPQLIIESIEQIQ